MAAGAALLAGGLVLLRAALLRLANPRWERALGRWCGNRWQAAAAGCAAAALLQSSSAVNLVVVNLVHARWLGLREALAIIIGANVGTTTTAQLLTLNLDVFLPYAVVAGAACALWARGRWKEAGKGGAALAALLTGIDWLGSGFSRLVGDGGGWPTDGPLFRELTPASLLLVGAGTTAVLQSSSLTIGVAMALARSGALTAPQGVAFVLGANVGTVATTLLGSLGATRAARQAALGDLAFNVIGVAVVWPLLPSFVGLVTSLSGDAARQIAFAHGLFNLAAAVLGLALLDGLVWTARRLLPG